MANSTFSFAKIYQDIAGGNFLKTIARHSDLLFPIGVMLAIGTFFISIPTALISILIVLNLAVAFIILGTSLYISSPLQLTAYPTILLITTSVPAVFERVGFAQYSAARRRGRSHRSTR